MHDAALAPSEAYRRAVSAYQAGELETVEQLCRQSIAAAPDFFQALHLLAIVQSILGKRDEALANYDRAIALRPDHAEAHCNRAVTLHALKRHEEALASYDRVIATQPHHAVAFAARGNILHQLKRFGEALASYDRAIAAKPDYPEAHANRGIVLHQLRRYADAVASYGRALAIRPNHASAWHNRACALQKLGRFGEALADHERGRMLTSGNAEASSEHQGGTPGRGVPARHPRRDGPLTVLSYCWFRPVGSDAVGGAEQVVSMLDRALVEAGHRSIVVACEGSRTAGTLVTVPRPSGRSSDEAAASARHREAIRASLERWPVDLVHLHGENFPSCLPLPGVPVLATLHSAIETYHLEALRPRPDVFLQCVSAWQHAGSEKLADMPHMLPPIENGIAVEDYEGRHARRRFALLLCRICPEKGVHLAIDAAKRADVPLLIAGEVNSQPYVENYFRDEVQPRLDRARRFIGPVGLARKRRLLAAARCVLLPSLSKEPGSLVAREALAAGTPVVAFPAGGLVDVIEHGRTGYLVEDVEQMAKAIAGCDGIDPELCRRVARERFSSRRMIEQYLSRYAALTGIPCARAAGP
jgi:glycosyltransferase involved in cell wall biosynthesis